MTVPEIIGDIAAKKAAIGGIRSVVFVACGGSYANLYPGKYFLDMESKKLRIGHYTSNEFVKATPAYVDRTSVVIALSQRGNTPETIAAAKKARGLGASTVVLTYIDGSPLTAHADYTVLYEWGDDAAIDKTNIGYGLSIAIEVLREVEGYAHYKEAIVAFGKMDVLVRSARERHGPRANAFAEKYHAEKRFYVLGSGPAYGSAYSFAICILMEMQWIDAAGINSGEFFHGPFEITDETVPFIVLLGSSPTRALDERALSFIEKYGAKIVSLDARELAAGALPESVAGYFDALLFTNVLRVYGNALGVLRNHPLTQRRYMWKVEY